MEIEKINERYLELAKGSFVVKTKSLSEDGLVFCKNHHSLILIIQNKLINDNLFARDVSDLSVCQVGLIRMLNYIDEIYPCLVEDNLTEKTKSLHDEFCDRGIQEFRDKQKTLLECYQAKCIEKIENNATSQEILSYCVAMQCISETLGRHLPHVFRESFRCADN